MQLDQNELADFIAETIVDAVKPLQKQVAGLLDQIGALETRLRQAEVARSEAPLQVAISLPETLAAVLEEVAPQIREAVAEAVAALPAPKDGKDGNDGTPGANGKDGERGEDGKSITVDDVMPVLESMHAKWALDFERRAQDLFQRAIDRMPKPKDGEPGKDGFGFDDMSFEQIDERSGVLRFTRGATVKEFPIVLAGFVDRGVWQEDQFMKGDGVTWEGNYWLARRDTKAKPGAEGEDTGNNDWRLAVRKGRKGKDGAPGRDLRTVVAKLT